MEHASVTCSLKSVLSCCLCLIWFLPPSPPLSPPCPCPVTVLGGAWVWYREGWGQDCMSPASWYFWQVARGHVSVRTSLSPPPTNLTSQSWHCSLSTRGPAFSLYTVPHRLCSWSCSKENRFGEKIPKLNWHFVCCFRWSWLLFSPSINTGN